MIKTEKKLELHLCPERSFVKPVIENFLPKRERRWKSIILFDIGRGVPPTKPLGLEVGVHMRSGHLLEFFDCHISDKEGGEMMVNLPHRRGRSKNDMKITTCSKTRMKY